MPAPDGLTALADDLRALPPRKRKAILAALKPFERARVNALLEERQVPASGAAKPAQAEPSDLERFSPWLGALIRQLREGHEPVGSDGNMTPAARRLALKLAQNAPAPKHDAAPAAIPQHRRSLLGAVGSLLTTGSRGK
jgi:hypothetical protein